MRTTTINFLEENIGVNLCDLCSDFWDLTPKAQTTTKMR